MATDFIIRTEDIIPEEILGLFVPTSRDLDLINHLKSSNPIILEGSRGTGKSFLLRVCEQQHLAEFEKEGVFPVYVSFVKSSLLSTADPQQFLHWMLARLCSRITRSLYQHGLLAKPSRALNTLSGADTPIGLPTKLELIADQYEESYKNPSLLVDSSALPDIETFRDAIEDIRSELKIKRFNILFDEAAHILRPEQQRQFFTLFRDLRSPYMTCNAAVYPGVTSYGSSFEMRHDARLETLQRDILSDEYLDEMRDIVLKQAQSELQSDIEKNSENFNALAYAANGNPRLLLKIVAQAGRLRSTQVRDTLKRFFREDIWAEHSNLAEKYAGHKALIDWGRSFIEQTVIPDTIKKNETRQQEGSTERTSFFWVHRDAPATVKEALRLLMYVGIINDQGSGIVATRGEIGTRYAINIGCLSAPSATPVTHITDLCRGLNIKRMTEYGANFPVFSKLQGEVGKILETDLSVTIQKLFTQPTAVLDLSDHLKGALSSIGIDTVGKAFSSNEADFQKANYVGPVRSRKIKNVTTAAVLEYLSG